MEAKEFSGIINCEEVKKVSASCMVIGLLAWPEIWLAHEAQQARHNSKHGAPQ